MLDLIQKDPRVFILGPFLFVIKIMYKFMLTSKWWVMVVAKEGYQMNVTGYFVGWK
jgi:hypothetical protein